MSAAEHHEVKRERDRLYRGVDAAADLHKPVGSATELSVWCKQCKRRWPCKTATLLLLALQPTPTVVLEADGPTYSQDRGQTAMTPTTFTKSTRLLPVFIVDNGNGQKITITDPVSILGTYNAERARGIVHTPTWRDAMADLQSRFDEGEL